MARSKQAQPILKAAEDWRDRCLLDNGSIFTGQQLWTKRYLDELDRYFVQNLDYGDEDFFTKLEGQLAPASLEAKKLAAEMFWVMYLMVSESAMGAETKRFQIRQVWEWSGEDLPEDHTFLGDLLAKGISHPGTAYHTHRWREFRFFITLMQDWKPLDHPRKEELVQSPWGFAEWLEEREYASGRQLRHILLYLLFPEQFERIATASHKRKIIREFRKKWDEDPEDFDYSDRLALDREVLRVRERLKEDYEDSSGELDFYREPLKDEWREKKPPKTLPESTVDWPDPAKSRDELKEEFGDVGIWLISAGGGGRLWKEFKAESMIAIGWDYLGDLTEYATREEVKRAISEHEGRENPTNDSLAAWEFVQEMERGDLVIAKQGNRRIYGWGRISGDYTYEPERGEYQHVRSVEWMDTGSWDLVGDQKITPKTLTEFGQYPSWSKWAIDRMRGKAGAGAPAGDAGGYTLSRALNDLFLEPAKFSAILDSLGRRRNVVLQGPPGVGKTFMARRLAYALIGRKDPDRVGFVQFHQSYSYEDFVQGWRPNEQGGFVLKNGVFHQFCETASEADEEEPFVFIIDEINRGNLSRIFGELMMLIESDKRGPDHAIPLTYSSQERFFVPQNVHMIGLMNTADRSLAMVDYALRRRFGFIDLEPAYGAERFTQYLLQEDVPPDIVGQINDGMGELNDAIRDDRRNLGPGFEIGHSYFVPSGEEEKLDDTWYEAVIDTEIAPLLREYWFDQPSRVDEHLDQLLR